MIVLVVILFLCIAFLCIALYLSLKKNFELLDVIDDTYVQIEESLDMLDEAYRKFYMKSKLEVFSDDIVVKELMHDIRDTKNVILEIANKITSPAITKEK